MATPAETRRPAGHRRRPPWMVAADRVPAVRLAGCAAGTSPAGTTSAPAERTSVTDPVMTTASSERRARGRPRAGGLHGRGDGGPSGGGARHDARAAGRGRPARPGDPHRPPRRRRGPARGDEDARRPSRRTSRWRRPGSASAAGSRPPRAGGSGADLLDALGSGTLIARGPKARGAIRATGLTRRVVAGVGVVRRGAGAPAGRRGRGQAHRGAAARRAAAGRRRVADDGRCRGRRGAGLPVGAARRHRADGPA